MQDVRHDGACPVIIWLIRGGRSKAEDLHFRCVGRSCDLLARSRACALDILEMVRFLSG